MVQAQNERERINNLKRIQSQTYKEFYALVDANRENMGQLRDMIQKKRIIYDTHTEQKLKDHYTDQFDLAILTRARIQAPELPEMDGTGLKNIRFHKR